MAAFADNEVDDEDLPAYETGFDGDAPPPYEAALASPADAPAAPAAAASAAAPAASAAAPARKKDSWLKSTLAKLPGAKSLHTVAQSIVSQAKRTVAEAGMLTGVTYGGEKFRAAFDMPDSEPLLSGHGCTLQNGEAYTKGQLYLTPSYLCIYLITASAEHHVKLALADVTSVEQLYCAELKLSERVPELVPMSQVESLEPNSVRLDDGHIHTFIMISNPEPFFSLLFLAWGRNSAASLAARPERLASPMQAALALNGPDVILGTFRAHVSLNSAAMREVGVVASASSFIFVLDQQSVIRLRWLDVVRLTPSRWSKLKGGPQVGTFGWLDVATTSTLKPNGFSLTSDRLVHRFALNFSFTKTYNLLVYAWAVASGIASPPFRYWKDLPRDDEHGGKAAASAPAHA